MSKNNAGGLRLGLCMLSPLQYKGFAHTGQVQGHWYLASQQSSLLCVLKTLLLPNLSFTQIRHYDSLGGPVLQQGLHVMSVCVITLMTQAQAVQCNDVRVCCASG